MEELQQVFRFESTVLQVGRQFFKPERDAEDRWVLRRPSQYRFIGTHFEILYERDDGSFVYVQYPACHALKQEFNGEIVEYWEGDAPSHGEIYSEVEAIQFLRMGQFEIPERLEPFLAELLPPEEVVVSARPLSYWQGKNFAGFDSRGPAHEVSPLELVEEVIDAAIHCIQNLREGRTEPKSHNWEFLAARLFNRYAVDASHWWGSQTVIPPSRVELPDLRWPPGADNLCEIIGELQSLLEAPLAVINLMLPLGDDDQPSSEELTLAWNALRDSLSSFEALTLELRDSLQTYRSQLLSKPEIAAPKTKVRQPTDKEFRLYHLNISATDGQTALADTFTESTGIPMTQGQVSKACTKVKKWLAAGNLLPQIGPEPLKSIRTIDPRHIDIGANREGRTKSQRGRRISEEE